MVDDSNLDYVRTFLAACHSTATVKQYSEIKNINLINDTERILVYPPEILDSNAFSYNERFMIKLSETNEANLIGMRNDIINNITKLNSRQTIAGYTKPSTLCNIRLSYSNKAFEQPKTKRWEQDIYLDIVWSTS